MIPITSYIIVNKIYIDLRKKKKKKKKKKEPKRTNQRTQRVGDEY